MRGAVLVSILFWQFIAVASDKNISEVEFSNRHGEKVKMTSTQFSPGEEEEFEEFVKQVEATTEQTVVVSNTSKPGKWFNVFDKENELRRTLFKSRHESEGPDKVGAYVAVFRTAYSSIFWIVISDFSVMQAAAMTTMQAAIHYSFTYKGYGLNILEFSKLLSGHIANSFGYQNAKNSKMFNTGIKYLSNFNTSNIIGAGFVAILAWETAAADFVQWKTYGEIAYYSVMSVFATGGWNSFLSEQKFASHPVISEKIVHRIFQTNGAIMAIAFPLMMNGYVAGHITLATMGITGIITAFVGHELLLGINRKGRASCAAIF